MAPVEFDPAPSSPVLLIGSDLMSRARLEAAVTQQGRRFIAAGPENVRTALHPALRGALVVLDLDGAGGILEEIEVMDSLRAHSAVIGFFSHVDEDLAAKARLMGIEAIPRGRFWRTLPEILGRRQ